MLTKIFDFILEVLELLRQALLIFIHRNRAVSVIFFADGKEIDMADVFKIADNDPGKAFVVQFVDVKQNPAPVDGIPVWGSSNETVLTVAANADGLGATITPVGPLGLAQLNVTGDADLGAGITSVVGTLDVEVVASEAIAAIISPAP